MEIDLIWKNFPHAELVNYYYIFACDDLPRILWHFLWMDEKYNFDQIGLVFELSITIGDEVSTTGMGSIVVNTSIGNVAAKYLNAASKNTAADDLKPAMGSKVAVNRNATIHKENNIHGNTTVNGTTRVKPELSESTGHTDNPRLRRLLEPLRALYKIRVFYINAPISKHYRQEIQTSLSRARPSIHNLFPMFFAAYEEAMKTYRAGYFILAIQKIEGTRDIVKILTRHFKGDVLVKMATGPSAGVSLKEALFGLQYILMNSLIRAYLQVPRDLHQLKSAQALAKTVIETYIHNDAWDEGAHKNAMAHYQEAEVWEALDELGAHKDRPRSGPFGHVIDMHESRPRSEPLREVIDMLKEALKYEPENPIMLQKLERRQKELEKERIIDEVREMENAEGAVQMGEQTGRSAGPRSAARLAKLRIAS